MTWTLAERFEMAKKMARGGCSAEDIARAAQVTIETAQLIWSRANVGVLDPFGRLKRNVKT